MSWLFFAILAPLFYAVVVFIDKYILEKEVRNYLAIPIYTATIAAIFGVLIWVITGFPSLSLRDSLLIILTGILTIFGVATYFKALSSDQASTITILFQMTPIITLILSSLLLGEKISLMQFLGFLAILSATVGISSSSNFKKISFSNNFLLILITDFFWASAYVLFKFVVGTNSFATVISYEGFGIGVGGFILYHFFPSIKNAFQSISKTIKARVFLFIVINEGIFLLSRLLTYWAISKGPVALVNVVGGTQVIFAILYGFILTMIAPKIFKESISFKGLSKKIIFAILVLIGLWLVQG